MGGNTGTGPDAQVGTGELVSLMVYNLFICCFQVTSILVNMDKNKLIEKTRDYVKKVMGKDKSGHDWMHVYRVWKNSILIGQKEGADLFIAEIAALLHDLGDYKIQKNKRLIGSRLANEWLSSLGVNKEISEKVCSIIDNMSFSEGISKKKKSIIKTIEFKVVQDADRLDAIGAIGIARVFAFGGNRGRDIYNFDVKPVKFANKKSYQNNNNPSINHFYEKLLLLKNLMNTRTGKKLAISRHDFMKKYLSQFWKEVKI
jgi:uncharacterized protein